MSAGVEIIGLEAAADCECCELVMLPGTTAYRTPRGTFCSMVEAIMDGLDQSEAFSQAELEQVGMQLGVDCRHAQQLLDDYDAARERRANLGRCTIAELSAAITAVRLARLRIIVAMRPRPVAV